MEAIELAEFGFFQQTNMNVLLICTLVIIKFFQLMLTVLPAAWTMCCFEKKTKKYTMIAQCIEPPNLNSPNNAEQTPTPDFDAYIISEDPPPNDNPDAPLIIL